MKANITTGMTDNSVRYIEVEILETFKFNGANFFIHYSPYAKDLCVSHFETGFKIMDKKYPCKGCTLKRIKTVNGAIKKAKQAMSMIDDYKFNEVINKRMEQYKTNKTEDFKIIRK